MRLYNAEPFGVESSGYQIPAPQLINGGKMTPEEWIENKYGASVAWFCEADMVEAMNSYALKIAQEAVEELTKQSIEHETDESVQYGSDTRLTLRRVLTRIKYKLTEGS